MNDLICRDCFIAYRDDILSKSEWVRYCENWEARRRRQEVKDAQLVWGLGDSVDIVKTDTGYRLILLEDL
jgi:hypothetical protein